MVTNPVVAARMGALEPRHFLSAGLSATPGDANGVPFSAGYVDMRGNLIADMRANVAAEAIGRTLAARLLSLTDDPGMKDLLNFLMARDTMHQQQWLAVLEELPDPANAPGDYENQPQYSQYAYAFFNHGEAPVAPDARWASGASLDGKGTFSVADPAPRLGAEPELAPAPPEAHVGLDATAKSGSGGLVDRVAGGIKDAVDKVSPS